MNEARESSARIDDWLTRLRQIAKSGTVQRLTSNGQRPTTAFEDALDDDLNISAALGFLFETIRQTNRAMDESKVTAKSAAGLLASWRQINGTLDFESGNAELPEEVNQLVEARAQARLAKDFRKSDE